MVKVDESEKLTKLAKGHRLREVSDSLHFALERAYILAADSVSQNGQLTDAKLTLVWVNQDLVFVKPFEN